MSSPGGPIQRACLFCRKRKLRCDRQIPRCHSCIRLGQECTYAIQRSTQRPRTERNHVQELEERLRRVETLLGGNLPVPEGDNRSPVSDINEEMPVRNSSISQIKLPKPETIHYLEKQYFDAIYPIMPLMHHERYYSSQPGPPPLYLRFSMWALATLGTKYSYLSSEYYAQARNLTEAAALADPRCSESALSRAQAWLHLAMYDMMSARFALVWTNTCQAIRLLQITKAHTLDAAGGQNAKKSWSEAEETRRAFWFAFCMDRSAFMGQGLPILLDEKDIHINLPASDIAYQSSIEEPGLLLAQTALGTTDILSPPAAAAVVYSLCSSTLKDLQNLDSTAVQKLFATNNWMQGNSFLSSLTTLFCVPPYFTVTKDNLDANLLYINVIIHCATLQVHRRVQKLARNSSSPLAAQFLQDSNAQCLRAASAIFELAQLASQSKISTFHPAAFFCIYNALVIFAECFLYEKDQKLATPITFLYNFMKNLCDKSEITRILVRDLETEYPSLIHELVSESRRTFAPDTGQPYLQGSVPLQPAMPDMATTNTGSDEDWTTFATTSYDTDSIPNGMQDPAFWTDQPIDMESGPLFRDVFQFNPNPQHEGNPR